MHLQRGTNKGDSEPTSRVIIQSLSFVKYGKSGSAFAISLAASNKPVPRNVRILTPRALTNNNINHFFLKYWLDVGADDCNRDSGSERVSIYCTLLRSKFMSMLKTGKSC